jgi:hypothetical protein
LALAFLEHMCSDAPRLHDPAPATTTNDDWTGLIDDDQVAASCPAEIQEIVAQKVLSFGVGAAITMIGVV